MQMTNSLFLTTGDRCVCSRSTWRGVTRDPLSSNGLATTKDKTQHEPQMLKLIWSSFTQSLKCTERSCLLLEKEVRKNSRHVKSDGCAEDVHAKYHHERSPSTFKSSSLGFSCVLIPATPRFFEDINRVSNITLQPQEGGRLRYLPLGVITVCCILS